MKLMAALIVLTAGAIAWRADLVPRVQRTVHEFQRHARVSYALAFMVAPEIELSPSTWTSTECGRRCVRFDVYTSAEAVDAQLELDDGTVLQPTLKGRTVRFMVEREEPTDVWLTWKPQVRDPGVGSGFIGCGQSLSEFGARPQKRPDGRVALPLKLVPRPGAIELSFVDGPFVP